MNSMQNVHLAVIAAELSLQARQVAAAAELLDGGATVPFIARYRKEMTGALDEVAVIGIRDRLAQLRELDARRAVILKSLEEQGVLTAELKASVLGAATMAALEDVYLPYRPKRRTRGMIAREKGLEPLAELIWRQGGIDPRAEAARFVAPDKGVASVEDALAGARDIIAEKVNEDAKVRERMRDLFASTAVLRSRVVDGKEQEGAKYKDYFQWEEPLRTAPSHRILAIRRGAREGILSFHILPDEEQALALLKQLCVKGDGPAAREVLAAARDGYKRLLAPSMETEMRLESRKRADGAAIQVFRENLRELLLAPPLGQKNVLAVDPGLRTGCKVVCMDRQGKLLHYEAVFPLAPFARVEEAARTVTELCRRFAVEAIAVGNGTGGREAEAFLRAIDFGRPIPVVSVNESGASVYSASETAREEFPDHDVTVRGAVSIGRRLMDPLAELVKIDPKSIGVGQYQHDVDQKELKQSLDDVVMICVNAVGVEVNTASAQLLGYVSGLGPKLARALVAHRDTCGPFRSRRALLAVSGIGAKTFEQAAGFLRIREAEHPLDASAVHPESYGVVEAMSRDLGCTVADLMRRAELRGSIDLSRYVNDRVGMPTLTDIVAELEKPGRDPRRRFEVFSFADGVHDIGDVETGMRLPGVVTNVTAFGAFVDIGVHQDGLVHVSQLADRFVKNPADVVKVNQKVWVTVVGVDRERRRMALSMRTAPEPEPDAGAGARKPPAPQGARKPAARPARGAGDRERGGNRPQDRPAGNVFARFFDSREKEKK